MNPEKFLMLKILDGDTDEREVAFKEVANNGVDISYFFVNPEFWDYIIKHKKKYKVLPSRSTFEHKFGINGSIKVDEPLKYYIDEIKKYKRYRIAAAAMDKADEFFAKGDYDTGIVHLRNELKKIETTISVTDMNLRTTIDERIDRYEYRIKNPGIDGIPSGLARLDEATYGWHGGEFNIIQAFLGNYKTWTMLYMARAALNAGYKVMIATVEMSQFQIARRLDSILSVTAFEKLRSGKFKDDKDILAFKNRMQAIKNLPDCILIGGVSFGELFLQSKIEEHEPDIVFIDGIYLMVDDNLNRNKAQWEQLNSISRGLKVLAENYNIPIVATTQAWKKSSKPGSKGDESVEDIAYSGGMAQNADNVVSLGRIYDPVAESFTNRVWVKLTKVREGEPVKFQAVIDFDNMTLREALGVSDDRSNMPYELSDEYGNNDNGLVEGVHYNVGVNKDEVVDDDEIPF